MGPPLFEITGGPGNILDDDEDFEQHWQNADNYSSGEQDDDHHNLLNDQQHDVSIPLQQIQQHIQIPTSQQLAQKMLASRGGVSNDVQRRIEDEQLFANPTAEELIPPWIDDPLGIGNNTATQTNTNTSSLPSANKNNNSDTVIENISNTSSSILCQSTNKSVTFNTKDEFHSWDEQLDVLKYIDEEFFNVAHYLIDVVGIDNSTDDYYCKYSKEEEELILMRSAQQQKQKQQQKSSADVGNSSGGCGGGGILTRLFGCGIDISAADVFKFDDIDLEQREREQQEIIDSQQQQVDEQERLDEGKKKYQLTNKLVNDFVEAVKYRMEIIENSPSSEEEEVGDERDVVTRTREVARKMYAYGLPIIGMVPRTSNSSGSKDDGEEEKAVTVDTADGNNENDDALLDTFGQGPHHRQYFPVLPINDDDEEEYGNEADENDQYASNQLINTTNEAATKKKKRFQLPTPQSVLSSLLGKQPKSSVTPNEEEYQRRLTEIRIELRKSTTMLNNSQNPAVQDACQRRINKLKKERQFYQIIQERSKVQSMLHTSNVESVKGACKERLKQLIYELETLQMEEDVDDDGGTLPNDTRKEQPPDDVEDSQWFERVLQYVNESATLHDNDDATMRMSSATIPVQQSRGTTYSPSRRRDEYFPKHHQYQNYYPNNPQQRYDDSQILPPRRNTRSQSPVARAVNSRTHWIG